jgi:DnaJ-class molecular chaperone
MTLASRQCHECRGIGKCSYGPSRYETCHICKGAGSVTYEHAVDVVQDRLDAFATAAMQTILSTNTVDAKVATMAYEMAGLMEDAREKTMARRKR